MRGYFSSTHWKTVGKLLQVKLTKPVAQNDWVLWFSSDVAAIQAAGPAVHQLQRTLPCVSRTSHRWLHSWVSASATCGSLCLLIGATNFQGGHSALPYDLTSLKDLRRAVFSVNSAFSFLKNSVMVLNFLYLEGELRIYLFILLFILLLSPFGEVLRRMKKIMRSICHNEKI